MGVELKGELPLEKSTTPILVVDDYEPWRRYFSTTLQKHGTTADRGSTDGLEAVQKAQELQPDLILLDIGLPILNGLEVARRIRKVSPASRILFVSGNRSADIAEKALRTGANGYVVKSDAESELLPAVKAVLQGKQFISASLMSRDSNVREDHHAAATRHCHEVSFHADDDSVVDGYARFIEFALKSGNAVIVVVTESHHASLLPRLEADGVNVTAAIKQGSYVPLDAADVVARLAVSDVPDPVHCRRVIGDLIAGAAKGVKGAPRKVAVCGEGAHSVVTGNAEAAVQLEHLWDEIAQSYGVNTLCGYLRSAFPERESSLIVKRICEEHSAVHGRDLGY